MIRHLLISLLLLSGLSDQSVAANKKEDVYTSLEVGVSKISDIPSDGISLQNQEPCFSREKSYYYYSKNSILYNVYLPENITCYTGNRFVSSATKIVRNVNIDVLKLLVFNYEHYFNIKMQKEISENNIHFGNIKDKLLVMFSYNEEHKILIITQRLLQDD